MRFIRVLCNLSSNIQVVVKCRVALHQRCSYARRVAGKTAVLLDHIIGQTVIHDQVGLLRVTAWLLSDCEKQLTRIVQTEALALNQLVRAVSHFQQARHDCAI